MSNNKLTLYITLTWLRQRQELSLRLDWHLDADGVENGAELLQVGQFAMELND